MSKFKPAKGPSLKTIFSKSIKDIEKGLWLCGDLCTNKAVSAKKYKQMACAVGLVSLYGGNAITVERSLYLEDDDGDVYDYFTFMVKEATYPSDRVWTQNSTQALRLLLENAPKGSKKDAKKVLDNADRAINYFDGNDESNWTSYGSYLSGGVIHINDDVIKGNAKKALKWFQDAARAGGVEIA